MQQFTAILKFLNDLKEKQASLILQNRNYKSKTYKSDALVKTNITFTVWEYLQGIDF